MPTEGIQDGQKQDAKVPIKRMISLSRGGRVTMDELMIPGRTGYSLFGIGGEIVSLRDARGEFEKQYISNALRKNDWNVEKCAGVLGITSRQLWNKISQYELHRPDSQ